MTRICRNRIGNSPFGSFQGEPPGQAGVFSEFYIFGSGLRRKTWRTRINHDGRRLAFTLKCPAGPSDSLADPEAAGPESEFRTQ